MANLTLSIDGDVLKRARIRALEEDKSVNAVVREFLNEFAGSDRARHAVRGFLDIAERSTAGSGAEGRDWAREDLYAERVEREQR